MCIKLKGTEKCKREKEIVAKRERERERGELVLRNVSFFMRSAKDYNRMVGF